ncbi:MAG: hypothetical protein ABJH05_14445 [Fulvivirga sp.]
MFLAPAGDAAIIEASTDNGATWAAFDSYRSSNQTTWLIAVNDETGGNESLYFDRIVDLGQFSAGEEILIRFRLENDNGSNGWGWFIDEYGWFTRWDLSIKNQHKQPIDYKKNSKDELSQSLI